MKKRNSLLMKMVGIHLLHVNFVPNFLILQKKNKILSLSVSVDELCQYCSSVHLQEVLVLSLKA